MAASRARAVPDSASTRWHQEIGIGEPIRPAHPAAELIELGEAETIGPVDQEGVGVGDVEPVFDDGGGKKDIGLTVEERPHGLLELTLGHLAVPDHDPGLGHHLVQPKGEGADGFDAIVDEVDLTAALHLVKDGLAHHLFGELADAGLHRLTVARWRLDERDVPQTAHGHVEGARDRRRGHGNHIDLGAQLFEFFLLGDAETLFLVEHDQTEIAEHGHRSRAVGGFR